MAHEKRSAAGLGPTMAQIVDDRATRGRWQWQDVDAVPLATDSQQTLSPLDIIYAQPCHFGCAHSQIDQTAGDRIVTFACGGASIKGLEQSGDVIA